MISNDKTNTEPLALISGKINSLPVSAALNVLTNESSDLDIVIDTRPNRAIVTVNLALNELNLSRSMIFKGTDLIENTGGIVDQSRIHRGRQLGR